MGPIEAWGFSANRQFEEAETVIELQRPIVAASDPPRRTIFCTIQGVAARSQNSKLGGEPIIVWFTGDIPTDFQLAAIPSEDHSVAFYPIKEWKGGIAYW